ncbi:class I SAM-dependent methyltransferase [Devosia sp.]|uniref:class I SAM-dependent methyltransferase n=1 Tax=Devosia sp. TaxID=1871048 RepID=UPI0027324E8D|nr:class I SAM-dependent methyltransferase [Devosia sp.]MDP2779756.1 class I SAM-dependent methyltransferase [Devosia sp.]
MQVSPGEIYERYRLGADWFNRQNPSLQAHRFAERCAQGALVLEVGAGSGADAKFLRRSGLSVVTTDIQSNVADVLCAFEHLPFRDSVFDGVYARGVIHLCDSHMAQAEALRVLRPGGTLFVSYLLDIITDGHRLDVMGVLTWGDVSKVVIEKTSIRRDVDHVHQVVETMVIK